MVLNFNEYIAENENRQNGMKSLYEVITGFKERGYAFYGFMHPYRRTVRYTYWYGPYLDHSDFTIKKDAGDAYNEYFFERNDIHYIPSDLITPRTTIVRQRDDAYSGPYNEHFNNKIIPKDGIGYYVFWCVELKYFYIIKDTDENSELIEKMKKERTTIVTRHEEAMKKWKEEKRKREEEERKREEEDRINRAVKDKQKSLKLEGRRMYLELYKTNPDAFKDITKNREIIEKIEDLIYNLEIPYCDVEMDTDPSGSTTYIRVAELDGVKYKYKFHTKSIWRLD